MYDNLCNYIHDETMEIDRKAKSDGKLSAAELQYADMLQHLKKSLLTNEAMEEVDGYSERRSSYGYYRHMDGDYPHESYARGRNMRRDSRGRYAGDMGIIEELHEIMEKAPESKKPIFRRFISEMEQ